MIQKLRNWLTTDGPGHTNYPERDIAAHRSIARTNRWIGYIGAAGVFGAWYVGPYTDPVGVSAVVLFILAVTQWVSAAFRLEALEWEVELLRGGLE